MTDTPKPKRPSDANQLAKAIVDIATGDADEAPPPNEGQRKGGLKGGRARARALSKKQRSEIARKAAKSRWSKQNSDLE